MFNGGPFMLKKRVVEAWTFSESKHKGQKRKFTGEDYFVHPKSVARLIEDLTKDENLVIAALLHDVVEDCCVTIEEIRMLFGDEVADYLISVTSDKEIIKRKGKTHYLKFKMVHMTVNQLILKLADRLDNVRYMDKDCKTLEQKQFVQKSYNETLCIIEFLKENRTDLEIQPLKFLIAAIELELMFLKIKYMW